jgi:sugar phosphate isomerase/epimerase
MYSLREQAEKDLDGTLAAVKAAGFDGVELAGMYGLSAGELRAKLDARGLKASGAHIGLNDILHSFERTAADARALGFADAVVPSLDAAELYAKTDGIVADFNRAAALCKKAGLRLCYHNHNFEFKGGVNYLYVLADGVPELRFEADVFWLKAADISFSEVSRRLGARLAILHIKEMNPKGVWEPNPLLGEGVSGIAEILEYAKRRKEIEWAVLEMEKLDVDYRDYLKAAARYMTERLEAAR